MILIELAWNEREKRQKGHLGDAAEGEREVAGEVANRRHVTVATEE